MPGFFRSVGAEPVSPAKPTIVVVDGDPDTRSLHVRVLSAEGFAVQEASTESDALELVLRIRPAVVMTSLSLPEGSGASLSARLIGHAATTGIIVIVLAPADPAESPDVTADAVLRTPCSARDVLAAVRRLVAEQLAEAHLAELWPKEAARIRRMRRWRRGQVVHQAAALPIVRTDPTALEQDVLWRIGDVCCTRSVKSGAVRLTVWYGSPPEALTVTSTTDAELAAAAERLRIIAMRLLHAHGSVVLNAAGTAPAVEERAPILNVDDYQPNLYWRSQALRGAGFSVLEAMTGKGALSLARERRPRLVLLDVNLPDIDGFTVCRELKSVDPGTFVVHVSAISNDPETRSRARYAGGDQYLVEPLTPDQLVRAIRSLVSPA